ncbi:MAG: HTH domain-containing protein [Clostridia bacterium]|nr:HTH domain-containing protein [Clostridia bacterium]
MTANERRAEIMRILTARRHETMGHLAEELHVTARTIRTDITMLTVDYPLETQRGNGGCVYLADWYHPHRNILSCEQQRVLSQLSSTCDAHQANVLRQMLSEYGSPQYRQDKKG